MVEMKRILFLTDFSSEADAALQYAKALATEFDGRLYLLHVIVDPTSKLYQMTSGDYHALDRNAREKAQEWLTRIQREHLGNSSQCETLIERGELFEHVLHAVHEHHIDVVALSAHTHPGFHLHLISSLPEKLVRKAPCHVFVIHNAG
ncbi:MAG: universal stress protein [Deltaproteobacteria bacterium]|nr:universal stress protein [Deltaproteobacteria bacterium]